LERYWWPRTDPKVSHAAWNDPVKLEIDPRSSRSDPQALELIPPFVDFVQRGGVAHGRTSLAYWRVESIRVLPLINIIALQMTWIVQWWCSILIF